MRTVHMHIVEEADLRGTRLSCVPRDALPAGAAIATQTFFATEEQLVQSVMQAFKAMLTSEAGVRHLLVLSAHGGPGTGTLIEVAPGTLVRLDKHAGLFEIRPPGLVTFASACWGGYPSVIQALRAGDRSESPFIVAPVVPVHPDDANELQRRLVDAMTAEERDDHLDALLEAKTAAFDKERTPDYAEAVFRFVRRNGEMVPGQGDAGLAQPMQPRATYLVVSVQRLPSAGAEAPGIAIVQAQDGRYWRVATSILSEAEDDAGVYALVGKGFTFRAKIHRYAGAESFGDMTDVSEVKVADRVPGILRLAPPYPHAAERTTVKALTAALKIAATSVRKCRRCNWASLSIKSENRGGNTRHVVEAVCHRNECGEHARWPAPG
jgi:hypothetical protein